MYANKSAEEKHGYERGGLLDENFMNLVSQKTLGEFNDSRQKLRSNKEVKYENKHIRKDGSEFNVDVFSENVDVLERRLVLSVIIDTSRQRAHKEELDGFWRRMHQILSDFPGLLYVADPKTRNVLFVNDEYKRLLGKDPVDGVCYRDLYGLENPCPFCRNGQDSESWAHEIRHPLTGRNLLVTERQTTWPSEGKVRLSMALDITERKQAEQELGRSREKYRITLESIGDGVIVTNCERRIESMNLAAEKLTGWSEEDAEGKLLGDVFRIINEDTREPAEDPVSRVLATGEIQGLANHSVLIKRDDTELAVADSAAPIRGESGDTLGVVLVFRDVSAERRHEQEREKLLGELSERVKELKCLYSVGYLLNVRELYQEEILSEVVSTISDGWLHKESAVALIRVKEAVYSHGEWKDVVDKQSSPLHVNGEKVGEIEVGYRKKFPEIDEGPFIRQERELIDSIAIAIAKFLEIRELERVQKWQNSILETTTDFVSAATPGGRILFLNKGGKQLIGMSEDVDVCDVEIPSFHPEWAAKLIVTEGIPAALEKGYWQGETALLSPEKGEIPCSQVILAHKDSRGQLEYISTIIRDISERKQLEEDLKRNEEMFRTYFDQGLVGMAITSPEKGWVRVNDRVCDILGYSREELAEKTWSELTHPEDLSADESQFVRLLEGDIEGYSLQKRFIRKDGRAIHTDLWVSCVRKDDGSVDYVLALINDICERVNAENALKKAYADLDKRVKERTKELELVNEGLENQIFQRHQAEEYALRQSLILEGINQVLLDGLTVGSEVEVAQKCLQVAEKLTDSRFGFIGEVNKDGLFDTIALSDPGWDECKMPKGDALKSLVGMPLRGIWSRVLKSGQAQIVNDPKHDPDRVGIPKGHPELRTFIGVPLLMEGVSFGMIALANKDGGYGESDMETLQLLTASFVQALMRKRAENALQRAHDDLEEKVRLRTADLKRSNEELERFAYIASHDLQEPLRMVASYLQLIERRYKDKLDEDAGEFIGFAVNGASRMKRMIEDLLQYSRLGTRGKEFALVDCEQIISHALDNLQLRIEDTHAEITHAPLPKVLGDESQLLRLFQNLLDNAMKFLREGADSRINIEAVRDGSMWEFRVSDNGIGIDSQFSDKIFIIFQRLHGPSQYRGTGIGLAMCKKIVERHGGAIWVESQVGAGSTFHFTLPVIEGEAG